MPTFVKFLGAGNDGKNLGFRLVGDDGKAYEFAITPDCFRALFAGGWKAAQDLPPAPDSGEAAIVESQVALIVVNAQPSLGLFAGPLVLSLPLSKEHLETLRSEIDKFESGFGNTQH